MERFWRWFSFEELRVFVESLGYLGIIGYFFIYVFLALIGVSLTFLTFFTGTIYGVFIGYPLAIAASTTAAMTAFFISRKFLVKYKGKKRIKNDKIRGLINKVEENASKRGFVGVVMLRLFMLPYIPLSYAAGFVKNLRPRDFFLGTLITNSFVGFFLIVMGASIVDNLYYFVVVLLIFVVLSFLSKFFSKSGFFYLLKKDNK